MIFFVAGTEAHRGQRQATAGKHYSITVNLFLSLGIISTSVTSKVQDLEANARPLINAADKYGIVNLKLEAEASYVKSTGSTVENIIDNILYAESKNCALLKEAGMDFLVDNRDDIIGKVSFDNVPGSMMPDLLAAMPRAAETTDDETSQYNRMKVGTLRRMLHEKGLDVDG